MYCKACGEELAPNQAICLKCGVRAGDGNRYCANCGSRMNPEQAACLTCGVAVKKRGDLNGQDKTSLAIICFFLGGLGVHNFMMGETKKGILKIATTFCFGIGYILALVDFIKILTDSYVIDPDKLI